MVENRSIKHMLFKRLCGKYFFIG